MQRKLINLACLALILGAAIPAFSQPQRAKVVEGIQDAQKSNKGARVVEGNAATEQLGGIGSSKELLNSKGMPYIQPRQQPAETRQPADPKNVASNSKSLDGNAERLPDPRDTSSVIDITKMQGSIKDPAEIGKDKQDPRQLSETGKAENSNSIVLKRDFLGGTMSEPLYNKVENRFSQIQSGPDATSFETRQVLSSDMVPEDGKLGATDKPADELATDSATTSDTKTE